MLNQHLVGNYLMQCCLYNYPMPPTLPTPPSAGSYRSRQIYRLFSCASLFVDCGSTLHRCFSCEMVIFPRKDDSVSWVKIAQAIFLFSVVSQHV